MAEGAYIGAFNVFRSCRRVALGPGAEIGNFIWIGAGPEYQLHHPEAGTLIMGENAAMTGKHYIDCSGLVELEPYAVIGGHGSVVQSHGHDLYGGVMTAGKIVLGHHSLLTTRCVVLQDAYLPPQSVLAAGGVLTPPKADETLEPNGLFAGIPAKRVRDLQAEGYFVRVVRDLRVGRVDSLD
ncbi:hypothetical protein FOS14_23580 [Skermania sp. ID1734]|uniref:acyltransferase n=1 Tax=Skermania sp. ID1734 TaxID=2597516 RepID=UPI00117FE469|nr:hypothetical protein [Skermania sp. ID1734]TSD93180.1 hypothetical protein FOS14_23580 [Skermania sp. ID1734]